MSAPLHFEAKLHAYRRTQDGAVISFVVHPDEMRTITELTVAPFGTRFMVAVAEIGDDEQPASTAGLSAALTAAPQREEETAAPSKPRRHFTDLEPCTQAGMRCNEESFRKFLAEITDGPVPTSVDAAEIVRRMCVVTSRKQLNTIPEATADWNALEERYQAWCTTQMHGDLVR